MTINKKKKKEKPAGGVGKFTENSIYLLSRRCYGSDFLQFAFFPWCHSNQ